MYDDAHENFYAFDLDKAKSLMQQVRCGSFAMDMVLITSPESTSLVQIYQADLATIGVTLNIVNMDLAAWLDNVNNRKYNGMYYSPAGISASVGTELTTSKVWQVGNNNSGFDSPEYQQLGTATTTETDPAKLKQLYKQVNDLHAGRVVRHPVDWRPPSNMTRVGGARHEQFLWRLVVSRRVGRWLSWNRVCFDLFTCPPRRSDPTAREVRAL